MLLRWPYGFDAEGRTAVTDEETHVRDLIEQVLFTAPGERVNRPTFGSGVLEAVFAPQSGELATTLQYLAQTSLHEWLGDLITVDSISVEHQESTLHVTVIYALKRSGQRVQATFSRTV